MIDFVQATYNRHPIVRPRGRNMGFFVSSKHDLWSTSSTAVLNAITPRNGLLYPVIQPEVIAVM